MVKRPARRLPDRDRQFGISVGVVLLLAAAYLSWQQRETAATVCGGLGLVLAVFGYFAPRLLKYPSAAWWKLAVVLGYVNSRIILTAIFVLVFTPLGLLWRLTGRDPLARRKASWRGWSAYPGRYQNPSHFTRMY
jgi:hypothetical protein